MNTKSGNDAKDDTTPNTISTEEREAGPMLLLSANGVKSMIEENLICGLCINEEKDLLSDRIGKHTKALVPTFFHDTVDEIVDDEKRHEYEQRKLNGKVNVVTSHVGCSSKVMVNYGRLHHVTCCKLHKRKVAKKKDMNGQEYVRNTLSSHEANLKVVKCYDDNFRRTSWKKLQ
eukprot:4284484-Ditylum_brightwellii.AAC.1